MPIHTCGVCGQAACKRGRHPLTLPDLARKIALAAQTKGVFLLDGTVARRVAALLMESAGAVAFEQRPRLSSARRLENALKDFQKHLTATPAIDGPLAEAVAHLMRLLATRARGPLEWTYQAKSGQQVGLHVRGPVEDPCVDLYCALVDCARGHLENGRPVTKQRAQAVAQIALALAVPGVEQWDQPTLDRHYKPLVHYNDDGRPEFDRRSFDELADFYEQQEVVVRLPARIRRRRGRRTLRM